MKLRRLLMMKQSVFRSVTLPLMVAGLMLALAPTAANAQATTFTDVFKVDLTGSFFVHECGEPVSCTGFTNIVVHGTTNEKGSHLKIHENDQGVDCFGQDSGLTYKSSYTANVKNFNFPDGCAEGCSITQEGHWDLQAPGPRNDLRLHWIFHLTVNNNGVLTADIARVNVTCAD